MDRTKAHNTAAVKSKKMASAEIEQLQPVQKVIVLKVDKALNEKAADHAISEKTASLRNIFANSTVSH